MTLRIKRGLSGPKIKKIGLKWPKRLESAIWNHLHLPSFWLVAWLICKKIEFGAKIGRKTSQMTKNIGPSAIPVVGFMVWPMHLEILGTPNIIFRISAGAEDVADHVMDGAGGPLQQSAVLAVRNAGDGVDEPESTWLMKEVSSWVVAKGAPSSILLQFEKHIQEVVDAKDGYLSPDWFIDHLTMIKRLCTYQTFCNKKNYILSIIHQNRVATLFCKKKIPSEMEVAPRYKLVVH